MSTLLARLIVKVMSWAQLRTHQYTVSKYINVSSKARIGTKCVFNLPIQSLYIGENTYLNEVHIFAGEHLKVLIGDGCAIGKSYNAF